MNDTIRVGAALPIFITLHQAGGWQRALALNASNIATMTSRFSGYTMSGAKTVITMNDGTIHVVRESVAAIQARVAA